jgi:hypothetical protein
MKRRAKYVSIYDLLNINLTIRQQVSGGALS